MFNYPRWLSSPARRRSWPLIPAFLILLCFALGLSLTQHGRAAVTSAFFLPDLMMPLPVRPVTWFTDDPIKEQITLQYDDGRVLAAEVYRPGDGKAHGAMILSPGAPPLEPDDSRLIRLASDVARAGFVMLIPYSSDLEAEIIDPREISGLVAAFEYLEAQPYVKPDKIGYIGVSVGAPLAMLAAADTRINEDVAYVVSFGGYYDATDVLGAITTGVFFDDGKAVTWEPRRHAVKVISKQIIARLADASDRTILYRIIIDRRPQQPDDLTRLTPEGRAAYDLLTNRDPARSGELLARLPPAPRQALEALSPAGRLDTLRAEVFILHDKTDGYLPYAESRRLRAALEGQVKLHVTETNIFEHVEPTAHRAAHTLLVDASKLYFHLFQILINFS